MPELKHNFLKGRMNKDLDERLVPNGEYRDALNIEISTSEDSNTGAVQNIKGNAKITASDYVGNDFMSESYSSNAITVGSYSYEAVNSFFNFIHLASDFEDGSTGGYTVKVGVRSDVITQSTPNVSSEDVITFPLVVDTYEVRHESKGDQPNAGIIQAGNFDTIQVGVANGAPLYGPRGIRVGMEVQIYNPVTGSNAYGSQQKVYVTEINYNAVASDVTISTTTNLTNKKWEVATHTANGFVWRYVGDRILNFKGGTKDTESNTTGTPSSETPNQNLITAISCYDDILFYTDNRNEPKKINIQDFSRNNLYRHIQNHSIITTANGGRHLKEEHITTIKKAPRLAPKIYSTRNPNATGYTISIATDINGGGLEFYYNDATAGILPVDHQFAVNNNLNTVNVLLSNQPSFQPGDNIQLVGIISGTTIQASVNTINNAPGGTSTMDIEVFNVDDNYVTDNTAPPQAESFVVYLETESFIGEDAFYFFSYKYKFKNGEKSTLAPYSSAVFLPKVYSLDPENSINEGMSNQVSEITIYDFVEHGISDYVESIELVYKSSSSENPVVFRTVSRSDSEFQNQFLGGKNKGVLSTKESIFGVTIPTKQQLRVFDNVPRLALAQDVVSSRVMYGNYVEGYDLVDEGSNKIKTTTNNRYISTGYSLAPTVGIPTTGNTTTSLDISIGAEGNIEGMSKYTDQPNLPRTIQGHGAHYRRAGNETTSSGNFLYLNYLSTTCPVREQSASGDVITQGNSNVFKLNFDTDEIVQGSQFWSTANNDFTVPTPIIAGQVKTYNINFSCEPSVSVNTSSDPDFGESLFSLAALSCEVLSIKYHIIKEETNGAQTILATYSDHAIDNSNDDDYTFVSNTGGSLNSVNLVANNVSCFGGEKFYITFDISVKIGDSSQDINSVYLTTLSRFANLQILDMTPLGSDPNQSLESPAKSVKTEQKYQIGIVYGDYYGRETSVIVDESDIVSIPKSKSDKINSLVAIVNSTPPHWADYYKLYIKEIAPEYYNIPLFSAYPASPPDTTAGGVNVITQATDYVWLAFNSVDRSKIEENDFLVLKKQHGSSIPVTNESAKFRVIDIVDNAVGDQDTQQTSTTFSINGVELLNAEFEDVNGKFFVKIQNTQEFFDHIGFGITPGDPATSQSAVFECRKKKIVDLDIFHEASPAYPIVISDDVCYQYVNYNDSAKIFTVLNASSALNLANGFNNQELYVVNVRGARTNGFANLNQSYQTNGSLDGLVEVTLDQPINAGTGLLAGMIVSFLNPVKGFNSLEIVHNTGDHLYCRAFSHKKNSNKAIPIGLPWWNVISFRNGVESDRILDDFNTDSVYRYTTSGKISGFESSIQNLDYKENRIENNIIFSQTYVSETGFGFNEFIAADDIIKQVNSEYGSIQKLYARMGDVVTFCEDKVLRILSSGKDALFNADGSQQLIASKNVLGQAVPYLGEYGISKNPESFAAEEYRLYFADKKRGSICRLSRDGITPISEAGMKDFFNDHLKDAVAVIGSYDGKKNEYNLTIHELTNPGVSKNVYTLGYKENVKGWTSFKSFIYESATTLSNRYYTFKNGLGYLHNPDVLSHSYCNFYGTSNNSNITDIFNESSSTVKLFKTLSYEGTQSKVIKFTDEVVGGVTYNDNEYYNEIAKSGWHVESIVTDMQEGDVDEFIEKEGKWYNYIKGIDTTFTNANATTTGVAEGNLDFNEFSVQGIGNLSADATISSGTLPTGPGGPGPGGPSNPIPGFIYSIDCIDGSNNPAWNQAGTAAANLLTTPNTVTVLIPSQSGYGIAAIDFTNATITLPSSGNVVSITFADTGTPYAFGNIVEATITLNSVTLTQDTFEQIIIEHNGYVIAPDQYEAIITVSEDFNQPIFGGPQPTSMSWTIDPNNSGVTNGSISLVSQTDFESVYLFTCTIPNGYNDTLLQAQATAGALIFDGQSTATVTLGVITEQPNYNIITAGSNNSLTQNIFIDYQGLVTNAIGLDDNNEINISLPMVVGMLEYGNYQPFSGTFNTSPSTTNVAQSAGTHQLFVNSNSGPFTATLVNNNFSPATEVQIVQTVHDPTNSGGSFVEISVSSNNSGAPRTVDVTITSDNNALLTDTVTVTQNQTAVIQAVAHWGLYMPHPTSGASFMYYYSFGNTSNPQSTYLYVDDLTGTNAIPSSGIGGMGGGGTMNTPGELKIELSWNAATGTPSLFNPNGISIIDVATGSFPTWLNILQPVTAQTTPYVIELEAAANTSGAARQAEITVGHPDDLTISPSTDPIVISQAASGGGGLIYKEQGANFNASDDFTDPATNIITFDHTAGPKTFWVQIPDADSNPNSSGIGYHGITNNGRNDIKQKFIYPNWYENVGFSSSNLVGITPGGSNGWNATAPTVTYDVPNIYNNLPSLANNPSQEVNYRVDVDMTQNYAVAGSFGWQSTFPVDREFTLQGFNPHNPNYPGNLNGSATVPLTNPITYTSLVEQPDDTIIIKQLAEPRAMFTSGQSVILPSNVATQTQAQIEALFPDIRANSGTPIVLASFFDNAQDAFNQTNSIGANWLTNLNPTLTNSSPSVVYNLPGLNLQTNFSGSTRYIGLSVFHANHPNPTAGQATPGNTSNSDYIVLQQTSVPATILFDDANVPSSGIHQSISFNDQADVFDTNGNQLVDNLSLTVLSSDLSIAGGDYYIEVPMIFGPNGSTQPFFDFISASLDHPNLQPTLAFNVMLPGALYGSFYGQNTANFDMTTGLLRVYIDAIPPSGTSYELNTKLAHMNNTSVFANLQLIITTP